MTEWEWTPEQRRALAQLGRAFAAAQKAGLAICGMDRELIAYKARELDAAERQARRDGMEKYGVPGGLYDAQAELNNVRGHSDTINHHGVYRDSGGW